MWPDAQLSLITEVKTCGGVGVCERAVSLPCEKRPLTSAVVLRRSAPAIRAQLYPTPGAVRARPRQPPVGSVVLAPGRARQLVFRAAGTGASWAGGRAASLLLLFSVPGARRDECGGARLRLAGGVPSSAPVFLSRRAVTLAAPRGCWPRVGPPTRLSVGEWAGPGRDCSASLLTTIPADLRPRSPGCRDARRGDLVSGEGHVKHPGDIGGARAARGRITPAGRRSGTGCMPPGPVGGALSVTSCLYDR